VKRNSTASFLSAFGDRLLLGMGAEQQREGRLASRDALSLCAERENLVFSSGIPCLRAWSLK